MGGSVTYSVLYVLYVIHGIGLHVLCSVLCSMFVLLFCLLLLFSFSKFSDVHTWSQSPNHHTCSRSPINHSPLNSPVFVCQGGKSFGLSCGRALVELCLLVFASAWFLCWFIVLSLVVTRLFKPYYFSC